MSKHMLTAATILGFDARKTEWMELKASMLTQLGPMLKLIDREVKCFYSNEGKHTDS